MVLVIDNYDSFTYNLVQYLQELGLRPVVLYPDEATPERVAELRPSHILISPGPGHPDDSRNSVEVVRRHYREIPIFGVCLGLQIIVRAFGGNIVKACVPMHGKEDRLYHDGRSIFASLPSPYRIVRYHSLVAEPESLPVCLEASATAENGEIMAVRHKEFPVEGVQFHPESILTEYGHRVLERFFGDRASAAGGRRLSLTNAGSERI